MIRKSNIRIEFPAFESAKVETLNNMEIAAWMLDLMAKLIRAQQGVIATIQPPKMWQVETKTEQTKVVETKTEQTPEIPKTSDAIAAARGMADEAWNEICKHDVVPYRDRTSNGIGVIRLRDKETGRSVATISVDKTDPGFTYVGTLDFKKFTDPLSLSDYKRSYELLTDELMSRLVTAGILPTDY